MSTKAKITENYIIDVNEFYYRKTKMDQAPKLSKKYEGIELGSTFKAHNDGKFIIRSSNDIILRK